MATEHSITPAAWGNHAYPRMREPSGLITESRSLNLVETSTEDSRDPVGSTSRSGDTEIQAKHMVVPRSRAPAYGYKE